MRSVLAASLVLLAGCGQIGAGVPDADDVRRAFGGRAPVLDALVSDCRSGKIGEEDVQVCDFCMVTVGVSRDVSFSGGRQNLFVMREYGNAAFKRALSADQPDIEPGPGEAGVWVMLGNTIREREGRESSPVPNEIARELGYRGATGWDAWMNSAQSRGVPNSVEAGLTENAALRGRVVGIVGACATPHQRSVPVSAPPPIVEAPAAPAPAATPPPPSSAEVAAARERGAAAARQASDASTSIQLFGPWRGEYEQGGVWTSFDAELESDGSRLSGRMEEVSRNRRLSSSVRGNVTGDEVTFDKTYDGAHTVTYRGAVARDGRRISGTWRVGGQSGEFWMERR